MPGFKLGGVFAVTVIVGSVIWLKLRRRGRPAGGVVLFRGPSGVGKSYLLRATRLLLNNRKVVRVSRDDLWVHLVHEPLFDQGEKQMLDDAVLALTKQLAHSGCVVLVDGCTFALHETLERFATIHPAVAIVSCDCSRATAEARLARDAEEGKHPIATRDATTYMLNKLRMQATERDVITIDTDDDVRTNAARVAAYIRDRIDFGPLS